MRGYRSIINVDTWEKYSMTFDGVDESISCGNISALQGASSLTFEFWMKPGALSFQRIMGKYSSSTERLAIHLNTNDIALIASTGGSQRYAATNTSPISSTSSWYHVVVVFSGGGTNNAERAQIYIDGSSQSLTFTNTLSTTVTSNSATWYLGQSFASSYYNGKLSDVFIYNSAFVPSDVTTRYNSGVPSHPGALSPINGWRMGEGATFATNWTVPDMFGSADGTSANMEVGDRTTDTP